MFMRLNEYDGHVKKNGHLFPFMSEMQAESIAPSLPLSILIARKMTKGEVFPGFRCLTSATVY